MMRDLLKAYLQTGRSRGSGSANNCSRSTTNRAMFSYIDALVQAGGQEEALRVVDEHSSRLLADNSAKVLERCARSSVRRRNPSALEKLLNWVPQSGRRIRRSMRSRLSSSPRQYRPVICQGPNLYRRPYRAGTAKPMHMQNYQQVVGDGWSTGPSPHRQKRYRSGSRNSRRPRPSRQSYFPKWRPPPGLRLTDTELFIS